MINRIFFSLILLTTLLFLVAIIGSALPSFGKRFLSNNSSYGDLFQMSKVTDFKIPLPQILPLSEPEPIADSDIIIMGDSFFNIAPGYPDFPSLIKSSLGLKVHNYNIQGSGEPWRQTNPLGYLEKNFYHQGKPKILILESVDRGISQRYLNINKNSLPPPTPIPSSPSPKPPPPTSAKTKNIPDKQGPIGYLESLRYEGSQLHLQGWAADFETGSPISKVVITLDGQTIGQANLNLPRADVGAHFSLPQWNSSGWDFTMPLKPKYGQHQVSAIFVDTFGNRGQPNNSQTFYLPPFYGLSDTFTSSVKTANTEIRQHIRKIDYFLTENFLNSAINELIATTKFRIFKQISPLTPKFSLNPKLLFYRDEVNFYSNQPNQENIIQIADNLAFISNRLKTDYNINFIFIPMPTKYTIYHHFAQDDLDVLFFDRLFQELASRKVNFVDLYHPFLTSREILYLSSDTHWNQKGIEIGVEEALKKIKQLLSLRYL